MAAYWNGCIKAAIVICQMFYDVLNIFPLLQAGFSLLCLSRPQNAGCQGDPSTKATDIE